MEVHNSTMERMDALRTVVSPRKTFKKGFINR